MIASKGIHLIQVKRTFVAVLLSVFCFAVNGQMVISGIVLDESDEPYIGAGIILNSGEFGAVSCVDGTFRIANLPSKNYEVIIAALGYQQVKHKIISSTDSMHLKVELTPIVKQLGEVNVNGSIIENRRKVESLSIIHVNNEFLKELQGSNLIQSLNAIPGVSSMDVGTGVSKPVIRGMGYYRVVFAQNGIKYEGQQWSNHHGISVDQQALGCVEIIKGPASLQYGSDAIGGVINVLPAAIPANNGVHGEMSFIGKSNTQWMGTTAKIAFREGDYFSNITLSYNSFGDFRIPETSAFLLPAPVSSAEASHSVPLGNVMFNTAGEEKAASIIFGVTKPYGNNTLEFSYVSMQNGFFDWQGLRSDAHRENHAQNLRDLNIPKQNIDNFSANYFFNRSFSDDRIEFAIGYQHNNSEEYGFLDDRTGNRFDELIYFRSRGSLDLDLLLQTISANAVYTFRRLQNHNIKVGVNSQMLFHHTDGYNHILPQYKRSSGGMFFTHRYNVSDKWIYNYGARLDFTAVNIEESLNPDLGYGEPVFNNAYNKTFSSTTFSAGVNYLPSANTILKLNVGSGFRVPSVYELAAYGLHRHEGRFEKGDLNNNPEKALQFDVALEHSHNSITFLVSPFVNYFTNYLYLKPTPELSAHGQVYEYWQTTAMLAGSEAFVDYMLKNKLNIRFGAEYVYAVNLADNSALPFTPPISVQTAINYLFNDAAFFKKNKLGLELVSALSQNYTVPNELSTPGYNRLNFSVFTDLLINGQKVSLMFKVQNALNTSHFNHISFYRKLRIPEPGRDFQLFISIPF